MCQASMQYVTQVKKKKFPSATTSPNVFFESFASDYLQLPPPVEGGGGAGRVGILKIKNKR